jgi:hypothetical protein
MHHNWMQRLLLDYKFSLIGHSTRNSVLLSRFVFSGCFEILKTFIYGPDDLPAHRLTAWCLAVHYMIIVGINKNDLCLAFILT